MRSSAPKTVCGSQGSRQRHSDLIPRTRSAAGCAHKQRSCRVHIYLALLVRARSRLADTTSRFEPQLCLASFELPPVSAGAMAQDTDALRGVSDDAIAI